MTIPFNPFPTISPQVIGGGGADPNAGFLQAMLTGSSLAQNAQQLQLQKQQEERIARETELKRENAKAEGEALRALLLQTGKQEQARLSGAVNEAATAAGVSPVADVPLQFAGPAGALANTVQNVPAESVAATAERGRAVLSDQQQYLDRARRLGQIEKAIGAIKDETKRPGARALLTFAEAGANLPSQVQQQLWPELFPQDKMIDPAALNAATTMFRTGLFTWGQARRQAGVPSMQGVPDDVKFQPFPTRPRQDQLKAGAQLDVMVAAKPILDEYSTRKAPGPLATWVKSGKAGGWKELLANPFLSAQDRQFLQAGRQFTDAWVRVVSGAQTNEHEYGRFIVAITEAFGDDEQTRQQKVNMRTVMIQAVADISGGAVTPTQAIDRALKLNWTPEQKKFLVEERVKAVKYEADIKSGKVKLDITSPSPSTPEDFQEQLDEIVASLRTRP